MSSSQPKETSDIATSTVNQQNIQSTPSAKSPTASEISSPSSTQKQEVAQIQKKIKRKIQKTIKNKSREGNIVWYTKTTNSTTGVGTLFVFQATAKSILVDGVKRNLVWERLN